MADQIIEVELWQVVKRSNYRQTYDAQFVQQTAGDMAEHGYKVEYPMLAYWDDSLQAYVVIDGNTRHESASLASTYSIGQRKAMLKVWICVKPKPTDLEFILTQLEANNKRRPPDPISDGIGFADALAQGASIEALVQAVGHDKYYIQRRLDLLRLNDDIKPLVASGNLGIGYASEMGKLDSNFQRIAMKYFGETKSPNLDEFRALVADLYTKQTQCSLFDLTLFTGQPIETILDSLNLEKRKSRAQLEAELAAVTAEKEHIRTSASAEILRLRKLVQSLQLKVA
jgi:hypothetical protein